MSSVDAAIVFLPRFSTLAGATSFTTQPMDVSSYGGVQLQIWRGPFRTKSPSPTPQFTTYFEESLDTETWVLGPSAPGPYVIGEAEIKFFSYDFRLRWFRLRVEVAGDEPIVSCWAEGLLRGGGGGAWPSPSGPAGFDVGSFAATTKAWDVDAWLAWRNFDNNVSNYYATGAQGPPPTPPSVARPPDPPYAK